MVFFQRHCRPIIFGVSQPLLLKRPAPSGTWHFPTRVVFFHGNLDTDTKYSANCTVRQMVLLLGICIGYFYRGGTSEKGHFFGHFCTFRTRVAITAPRRPKRTKPGSKAVWVLGNRPVAGFARRFGRLARQHVRCGAHMCPLQGQKSALGGRSNTRAQPRFAANIRAQTML